MAQAAARAEQSGVPAKGVTGTGYSGHYFWDTEIFVVPFPHLHLAADGAQRAAFPLQHAWCGAPPAEELPKAVHSSLGVRSTERRHRPTTRPARRSTTSTPTSRTPCASTLAASGDQDFMNREGVDILVETARLWADLGFWRENGTGRRSFHIHGVTGPDEYTTVVNDNLFTNVMARYNLAKAAELLHQLKRELPRACTSGWRCGSEPRDEGD